MNQLSTPFPPWAFSNFSQAWNRGLARLLGCNEALNVFLAALDHDRQSVRGSEVILYVFPRGDGPFSMTHLVPPRVLLGSGLLRFLDEPQEVGILADSEIATQTEGDGQLEEVLDPCG